MKKIVLTSIGALMLTALSAGAAETTCSKGDCSNYKIFFGINAGMLGVNYDGALKTLIDNLPSMMGGGDVKSLKLPEKDTVIGMEGGMRFGKYKNVWNGGFTISAEKTLGKKIEAVVDTASITGKLIANTKLSVNAISATFDNYIRLNKSLENRLDLVVGVGIAEVETNVKLADVGMSLNSHAAVLKAGLELELTDNISMTLGSRMYMPVAGQYYGSIYNVKAGFKFLF